MNRFIFGAALATLCFAACQPTPHSPSFSNRDWYAYQGDAHANQYSALTQINTENVGQLSLAWTYACGDSDSSNRSQIQCNPLIINGILYGSSPKLKAFALHAETGEEIWRFDPFEAAGYQMYGMGVNRGLAYWTDGSEETILYTAGSFLYALNAKNGALRPGFGKDGKVDLHKGLGREVDQLFVSANTPGVIYRDLLILGTRVSEQSDAAPGHIRAYDVRTGAIRWMFKTIPEKGEFGADTWPDGAWDKIGGANCWSGMSIDHERGMVFIPTGSASFDFYGGDRHGANLFANCILALDANTGERIWHYQTVHHDIWDRDLPAPPNLVQVKHEGKIVDAVAQITKSAYVFLLDRDTGEPLFPVEEISVPPSDLEGELAYPTQPVPSKPPAFSRNQFTESDISQRSPEIYAEIKSRWESYRHGQLFIPPSREGSIVFPGFDGGGEWGGASVDPQGIMYINASEMPWVLQMVPVEPENDGKLATVGKNLYMRACMSCHGIDLEGASIYETPSLVNIQSRLSNSEIAAVIKSGKGQMPAFGFIPDDKIEAIVAFLTNSDAESSDQNPDNPVFKHPFVNTGYIRFTDADGYPAIRPPWGTLNAIDLNKGEIIWKVPLGNHEEVQAEGAPPTGTENYGGPVSTAGDLIFIAATSDHKIRAFHRKTGEELWSYTLPAGGYATPSVYEVNQKQFVVIAAGGGKMGTPSGDQYLAFRLPD